MIFDSMFMPVSFGDLTAVRHYLILCRHKNVEAAVEAGMIGVVFENAKQLERDLAALGCNL